MYLVRFMSAAALVWAALNPTSVLAGQILDDAKAAEGLLADAQPVKALAALEDAFNVAWDAAPLGFSEALFVTAKPTGFGIYDARPTPVFQPDEQMLVYAEPFGYGFGKDGDLFKIDFAADFQLRTAKGQILHSQDGFASLDMKSRRRNKEFQVFIVYNFKGLKAGDYVLETTLHDRNSPKVGSFELPFTIAERVPATVSTPGAEATTTSK